ncbi:hypothetical protein CMK22_17370 [Candidatus Poribacteria bacterium]|nr:hypothetical protein [Candidatus Poribacteria bacterium]
MTTVSDDFSIKLLKSLGGEWPPVEDLNVRSRQIMEKDGFTIESVYYNAEVNDVIPAFLLIPESVSATNPAPAVAVWHQHAGQYHLGKSEPAGLAGDPMHHTGSALAKAGYVVLCPDAICFEERQNESLEARQYEEFEFLRYIVGGKCLAWKNILDMKRAIDFLVSRPEVQTNKIGCYGHSMGSTHTWLIGPWEDRLKCLVANCCLPTYAAIQRQHILHCFPNFIPKIQQYGDTPNIVALIAPKPLHMNFGELDGGSPIEDVRAGMRIITQAYTNAGVTQNFSYYIENGSGHILSKTMWKKTIQWFDKYLKNTE